VGSLRPVFLAEPAFGADPRRFLAVGVGFAAETFFEPADAGFLALRRLRRRFGPSGWPSVPSPLMTGRF
jgi:hypothetical protein